MKKMFLILASFLIAAGSANAQNFEGPYVGATVGFNSYTLGDTTALNGSTDDSMSGATFGGLFGVRSAVTDTVVLGVEGFVNANMASKDFTLNGVTANLSADVAYGADAIAGIRNDQTLFFVMAGYGWNDVSAKVADIENAAISAKGKGIRLGAGAEFMVAEQISVRVQGNWQDFDNGGESSIGGLIGAIYHF